jgi:anti-sigma factor RsiW
VDESHLTEDELIALALGDLRPEQAPELRHLSACQACRTAYGDLSQTIDSVLPAAPALAPPAGFDARVLDRIEIRAPEQRRSYRIPLLVAAAAIIGLSMGAIGARALVDQETITASDNGAVLVTAKGSTVGTVEPSQAEGQQVVVLQVTDGRPGTRYTCRVRLDDGTARDAGEWVMPESGHATWIVPGSSTSMERVELVTDDGRVWSSARLN